MENVIFLFLTSFLGVIHKGTGNVGPTLALKLEGSGCRVLEGHLGLMKPPTHLPGVMNCLQAQMEGFTQKLVFIYFIILSQERRKLLLYLCVPECPLSNLTKAISWSFGTNSTDHPSTSSVTLTALWKCA